jgi:hypothetical protein
MKRLIVRLATTVLVSGGLGLAGLALAGTAQAIPGWCPGDPPNWAPGGPPGSSSVVHWDWNVCHNYHYASDGVVDDDTGIFYPYGGDPRPWVQPPLAPASSPGGPECIGLFPLPGVDPSHCVI